MRIFSIADIHGEADKLANLLVLLKTHHSLDLTKDKLVFTGDYIDRGKDSYRVLALIYELQKEFPNNIVALAGNHEWMMVDYHIHKYDGGLWHANEGKATERSFYKHHGSRKCPGHLLSWLMGMPLHHIEEGFFFSHAPLFKGEYREYGDVKPDLCTLASYVCDGVCVSRDELIWNFHPDYLERARVFNDGRIGVCGHIHDLYNNNPHPRFTEHYIFGDAGCGCNKDAPLCAINVHTREVVYSI